MKAISLSLLLVAAGCSTSVKVPSNEILFHTDRGELRIKHPQNTEMNGVDVTISGDGSVHAQISTVKTSNDPDVIQKTADGQAKIVEATGSAIEKNFKAAQELAGTMAGAAAKTAAKP
jgi:hypothetical protein